ncbi:hypothetical protein IAU59_000559 [Kwoniella sp. CBS 9459]
MAPSATSAGPSSQAPVPRQKGRKGKAGGNGKKGKVFVEGKADLLSLISDITSSKDSEAQQKVDKRKNAIESHTQSRSEARADDKGKKSRKAEERDKALESAKSALLEKQRLKKTRKTASKVATGSESSTKSRVSGGAVEEGGKPAKKRVLFA